MLPAPALVVGTLVLALPALVLAWCAALRRRQRDRLAVERILRLQRRIDAALNDGFDHDSRRDFAVLLHTASLTTDLQTPRLRLQAGIDRQPPEKYRILGQLADRGLDATVEAGQLLSLMRVVDRGR
jgi:hypothetical protein